MAQDMTLRLNGPGMTSLHKVGLAGLYMTLKAFERSKTRIEELSWELHSDRVVLHWEGENPKKSLEQLVQHSFKIDNDGFFRLAGLENGPPPTPAQKHLLYNALLNTFLKQSKSRNLSKNEQELTYTVDDKLLWFSKFKRVEAYNHRDSVGDLLNNNGSFKNEVEVIGWLYPGNIERHSNISGTRFKEPTELALCLWYAPVGSIYFRVYSKVTGTKSVGALLIPDVLDLERYALLRQSFFVNPVHEMTASGSSDAALRFMVTAAATGQLKEFEIASKMLMENHAGRIKCRVITFGSVPWNKQENSRTAARSIVSTEVSGLSTYYLASSIFRNAWQSVAEKRNRKGEITEPEHYFIKTSVARELIAENIARGAAWFDGFSQYMANKETRKQLTYEKKELSDMVNQAMFDDQAQKMYVQVCHEAIRRYMGKKFGRQGGANWDTEYGKIRIRFSRCKNAPTLREAVIDLWSRAGSIPELQEHWSEMLTLFSDENWRKTKDLALLALASYQPANKADEDGALALTTEETEGDGNE